MPYHKGLTPATKKFFEELRKTPTPKNPFWTLNEEKFIGIRDDLSAGFKSLASAPCDDVICTEEFISIGENNRLNIQIIRPKNISHPAPTLVYFPGVGFTLNLDIHWIPCSLIAKQSDCQVIIVNCNLAPEHKFPEGPNEAFQAIISLYEKAEKFGIDKDLFAIGGDSSGGNFAALATIRLTRERADIPIKFQLLISPNVDETLETYDNTPFKEYQDQDLMVSREIICYFRDLYIPNYVDLRSPDVSPLFADLKDLPPTIISCAEYDGIRGDTEAYYEKLKMAGNSVEKIIWEGLVHNSMLCREKLYDGENPALIIGNAVKKMFLNG
jgi:acetyl esterase